MSARLLADLRAAGDQEAGAQCLLSEARGILEAGLRRSRHRGRVVGLSLHLREGQAYRAHYGDQADPLASATAWSLLQGQGRAALIDVEAGRIEDLKGQGLQALRQPFSRSATRAALGARSATHLGAFPLRDLGQRCVGMLSVLLSLPSAVGTRLDLWDAVGSDLQLLADLGAPYLARLPAPVELEARPLGSLPVVGAAMRPVVAMLQAFAPFEETLLLRGATGTGKSHLARWVHEASPRSRGPFVSAQLHTLAESLREGELFGWRKGAFTGAQADRSGLVSQAQGGTLFLDEIDKLDLGTQAKLLRLLEERRFSVLGETGERTADLRFVVGSNVDLERAVSEGRFLEDLYFRINVLPVALPELSERRDEIAGWAGHMLGQLHRGRGRSGSVALHPEALEQLEAQAWPGNLRQLNSVLVRAYAFASMEQPQGALELGPASLARSLELDRALLRAGVGGLLEQLGHAFVRRTPPPRLELAEGLKGAVLHAARQQAGGLREAFELLGLEGRLKGGNHLKTFRREHERLEELMAALGEPMPPGWTLEKD